MSDTGHDNSDNDYYTSLDTHKVAQIIKNHLGASGYIFSPIPGFSFEVRNSGQGDFLWRVAPVEPGSVFATGPVAAVTDLVNMSDEEILHAVWGVEPVAINTALVEG